jgi:hypothetical protein
MPGWAPRRRRESPESTLEFAEGAIRHDKAERSPKHRSEVWLRALGWLVFAVGVATFLRYAYQGDR